MAPMTNLSEGKRDFFVSFNQTDRAWATWIAWVLEETGYSVFFQDWDFAGNFVLEMDRAHQNPRRTLAVLSPDYLASRFTAPEWAARFAEDATSAHDRLIPVRVQPCTLDGLLAQVVSADLVGCDEAAARDKLLRRVVGIRLKPDEPPLFPGGAGHEAVPERPAFPARRGDRTTAHHGPVTGHRPAPSAAWLVGGIAATALVVVVWLLVSSGDNVTANGGIAAGRDLNTGGPSCVAPVHAPKTMRA